MVLHHEGAFYKSGSIIPACSDSVEEGKTRTMAYGILKAHNTREDMKKLALRFDSLTSHDITYVGIIQTARASGLTRFPMPYVLTNCHNSLCAVGGTINEDDHRFALSAAHKYGGIYVPANMAVIHSYNREEMTACGRMILGSDSHTRYGALGTMGIGEGGGELAKQLLNRTYDMAYPGVVGVYVTGKLRNGVGPQDVALALVAAVYENGFVKNKVMEFFGPGIASLSQDTRNGIDVMTTETTCWSSIWSTDDTTKEYFEIHGRPEAYKKLEPADGAYYDSWIELDLSGIESMIALPMHPSYALPIRELLQNPREILQKAQDRANKQLNGKVSMDLVRLVDDDGNIHVDQAVIAGCSGGTFENICAAAQIVKDADCGNGNFRFSVYPDSMPTYLELVRTGMVDTIVSAGGIFRECFCGPCFGAGDTPANGEFSIRHTTRNFPNREGSKPGEGQIAEVALMDARSIAATAANGGILTAACENIPESRIPCYRYDRTVYDKRVYNGWGREEPDYELRFGPNIKDWPEMPALPENLLVRIASSISDPVTTTDELIPSGETSSFRSNPLRLAEFTLSRKDPLYVGRAKETQRLEENLEETGEDGDASTLIHEFRSAGIAIEAGSYRIASAIYAKKPGDGSAREQAASCQRVLGGAANFALEYATKRYRSNCINWGMVPFTIRPEDEESFKTDAWVWIPDIRSAVTDCEGKHKAYVICEGMFREVILTVGPLTEGEKEILLSGCLINYYRS